MHSIMLLLFLMEQSNMLAKRTANPEAKLNQLINPTT